MRFWDSSAILGLCLEQAGTAPLCESHRVDPKVAVWWATRVECMGAFARLGREGQVPIGAIARAREKFDLLASCWSEVMPLEPVRSLAERLAVRHFLKAGDAFQLAAAISWFEHEPEGKGFLAFDKRLVEAARREGFSVLP